MIKTEFYEDSSLPGKKKPEVLTFLLKHEVLKWICVSKPSFISSTTWIDLKHIFQRFIEVI